MGDEDIVRSLREEVPGLAAVYRFGSSASAGERSDSDVDIAYLTGNGLDPLRRFAIQERLALELHRDVDLVDLARSSTVMRMQVVAHGRVLFDPDPPVREAFEDYVFSSYARLNEERRAILQQVARDGNVYGG
jgi:predicted nucleotidyltransferase